ncbi:MAG: hypothetical protein WD010_07900, partial [Nitriliruptor sp.]
SDDSGRATSARPYNVRDRGALHRAPTPQLPTLLITGLAAGVPVKVVSDRLGHTKVAMTLDVYAHVLPAMDRDAADRFG